MNSSDPLSQLKDIHLPGAPGLWPIAPGWWILLILLITVITVTIYLTIRYLRKNRYRKMATLQAENIINQFHLNQQVSDKTSSDKLYIEQAISLLKQVSLHRYPNDQIATLSANQCLHQLNQYCKKPVFPGEICRQLEHSLYTPQPTLDIPFFHQMMKEWITHHR